MLDRKDLTKNGSTDKAMTFQVITGKNADDLENNINRLWQGYPDPHGFIVADLEVQSVIPLSHIGSTSELLAVVKVYFAQQKVPP